MDNTESRAAVQRDEFADYLNVGTLEKPNYVLMGVGFTTLNESPGAKTKTKKYVNERTSSTSIVSYESKFPFESDLIKSQEAVIALYNVGRNHYTGADTEFDYVRVELWDKIEKNVFAARKFKVAAEISDISGEDDQVVKGNLNAIGDPVFGVFNTETKMFTETSEKDENISGGSGTEGTGSETEETGSKTEETGSKTEETGSEAEGTE